VIKRRKRRSQLKPKIDRNPFEKMSASELFATKEWGEHLDGIRPFPITSELGVTRDKGDQGVALRTFVQDADLDEEVIMSRFHDYLQQPENRDLIPVPATVLHEFLESFGALDLTFWKTLPIAELSRVTAGEILISRRLSERLSCVFGTRPELWVDMQAEFDERQSAGRLAR